MTNSKEKNRQLLKFAEQQAGYFTAKQAQLCGYADYLHVYHVKNGDWERVWRGIYRLTSYPTSIHEELMLWYLWSSNRAGEPQAIYSYDTALELQDLSTWTSSKLHMTVPKYFQRMAVPPPILRLHKGTVRQEDITYAYGVPVTKPLRTILDLSQKNYLDHIHILEAFKQAKERGLILQSHLSSNLLTEGERDKILTLDKQSNSLTLKA